jgi:hypothetical protein
VLASLFDPYAGIGINLLRQPMGATDFSASGNYSYDDVPAGQTDPNLAQFSIAHAQTYLIPLLRLALSINPSLQVQALPWSPPAWMKTSGSMNGGNVVTTDFAVLAQYFTRFINDYQQQGVPIYAVSMQNEPLNSTSSYLRLMSPVPMERTSSATIWDRRWRMRGWAALRSSATNITGISRNIRKRCWPIAMHMDIWRAVRFIAMRAM